MVEAQRRFDHGHLGPRYPAFLVPGNTNSSGDDVRVHRTHLFDSEHGKKDTQRGAEDGECVGDDEVTTIILVDVARECGDGRDNGETPLGGIISEFYRGRTA